MKTPINKILAFFTVALLITNIGLVYFLWKDKKTNAPRVSENPSSIAEVPQCSPLLKKNRCDEVIIRIED